MILTLILQFIAVVIILIAGAYIYRQGTIDGQRVSKGQTIKPIIEKEKENTLKNVYEQGWNNILSYDGTDQKGSDE